MSSSVRKPAAAAAGAITACAARQLRVLMYERAAHSITSSREQFRSVAVSSIHRTTSLGKETVIVSIWTVDVDVDAVAIVDPCPS
jgi:hypothetical protein